MVLFHALDNFISKEGHSVASCILDLNQKREKLFSLHTRRGWIQDSPQEGTTTLQEGSASIQFARFSEKLHEIKKILVRRGWGAPLRSATARSFWQTTCDAVARSNVKILLSKSHRIPYSWIKNTSPLEMKLLMDGLTKNTPLLHPHPDWNFSWRT